MGGRLALRTLDNPLQDLSAFPIPLHDLRDLILHSHRPPLLYYEPSHPRERPHPQLLQLLLSSLELQLDVYQPGIGVVVDLVVAQCLRIW